MVFHQCTIALETHVIYYINSIMTCHWNSNISHVRRLTQHIEQEECPSFFYSSTIKMKTRISVDGAKGGMEIA